MMRFASRRFIILLVFGAMKLPVEQRHFRVNIDKNIFAASNSISICAKNSASSVSLLP